jgi:hypothetical protein
VGRLGGRPPAGALRSAVLSACAGFLLAVLWMDLMFDVQVLADPSGGGSVPEAVLASIATYYRRVTTDASPMGTLIATVMAIAVSAALWQLVRAPERRHALILLLIVLPVALALGRVVPNAVRLGARADPPAVQEQLALGICREHLACFASVAIALVLQLRGQRSRHKRG